MENKFNKKSGICANCGSNKIVYGEYDIIDGIVNHNYHCPECGGYGAEYFNLVFDENVCDEFEMEEN